MNVLLAELLGVTLRVGSKSTVILSDMLMEREDVVECTTLRELVGERETETESEDDAEVVWVIEEEDDGLRLTLVDTVAETLIDNVVLSDSLTDSVLDSSNESDDVAVVV